MYGAYKSQPWMEFFESLGYYTSSGNWSSTPRNELVALLMEDDRITLEEAYDLSSEDTNPEIAHWEYRQVQDDRDRLYKNFLESENRISEEQERTHMVSKSLKETKKALEEIKDKVRSVGHDQFCRYRPSDPDDSACDCLRREVLALFPTEPKVDTLADSSSVPENPAVPR